MNKEKLVLFIKKYSPLVFLVLLVISFLSNFILSAFPRVSILFLILAALLIILYLIVERKNLINFLKINKTQKGINSIFAFVFFFLIIVALNFIFSNHDLKHDFTRNKINTLSEQTVKVLKSLDKEVNIIAFIPSMQSEIFNSVVDKYKYYTNKINSEIIDPSKEPIKAKSFSVTKNNTFVVVSGTNESKFYDELSEENLTNAIIKVLRVEKKKIYFLSGHGEKNISDESELGYVNIKSKLEGQNYQVNELNLVSEGKIPEDAKLLVIAGASKPFFEKEKELILEYVSSGNSLILLVDPIIKGGLILNNNYLDFLLNDKGLNVRKDIIVDPSPSLFGATATMPVVSNYSQDIKITKDFEGKTFFPNASSITINEESNYDLNSFCESSNTAWGETSIKGGKVSFNTGVDVKGPLNLCVLAKGDEENKLSMVLVGDSDFISNQYVEFVSNSDLFLNMVSYLLKDEDLLSIRPKTPDVAQFSIEQSKMDIVALVTMYLVPFIVLTFGVIFWYRRRKL